MNTAQAKQLSLRDQIIEARFWQQIMDGKNPDGAEHLRRTVNETISEVEKNLKFSRRSRRGQPTIARAISAVRARQKTQLIKSVKSEQWYVNFPSAVAQAIEFEQGEVVEWLIDDHQNIVLQRSEKQSLR